MRRLMVIVLLALGWVALSPATAAYACDTASAPRAKQLTQAEAVFTATVKRVTADRAGAGATTLYVVEVDRVFKGERVNTEETVSSPTKRAKCGLVGVTEGNRYLFVAGQVTKGTFQARSFQGTQAINAEVRDDVERVLGEGTPPADAEERAADDALTTTRVDETSAPSVATMVVPGLVLALIGCLVLVLTRIFGRPDHP
ncbi:hypothetical protein ncot_00620 [Nocardioides sp. JQ2195]|uniref:hypothetical protein n=1 Tax=Nocardioides sp. JQ2195 TaxID=2592334 RepID=UPI00143E3200|nr:hypothetical protein [Nocardioides sp. JQ2195]QIX25254.1 hypothetical protein ncot_00620 [Nocardioides sp. JQ2195]